MVLNKRGDTRASLAGLTVRRALYLRVSTEDQAERGTIKNQADFLRSRTDVENQGREMQGLPPIVIVGMYVDDGISGAIPMSDRPEGSRLLADARSGAMDHVLSYRLDRLGRSLRVLMEAHDTLESVGVSLVSATEPFDTSTSFGKAMFGFLGVMAELERSTIAERTAGGRARAIRAGRWTQGPIPFGYDLDADHMLIPSTRIVPTLGITEAELVRQIFSRVGDEGQTAGDICRWLNAVDVSTVNRYRGGGTRTKSVSTAWGLSRVTKMLHRPVYKGVRRARTGGGIEQECTALVSADLWQRVQEALRKAQHRPPAHTKTDYLLTGLIRCAGCGGTMPGSPGSSGKYRTAYYQCNNRWANRALLGDPCPAAVSIRADWLEPIVWSICLEEARREDTQERLRALYLSRQAQSADREDEREGMVARLGALEGEKDKVVRLYRKSLLSEPEAEAQMTEIASEMATLRSEIAKIDARQALDTAMEDRLAQVAVGMAQIRTMAEDALEDATTTERRILVEAVIDSITVTTEPGPKRSRKRATVVIRHYLGGTRTLEIGGGTPTVVQMTPTTC